MAERIALKAVAIGIPSAVAFVSFITWWPLACRGLMTWLVASGYANNQLAEDIGLAVCVLPWFAAGTSGLAYATLKYRLASSPEVTRQGEQNG